MKKDIKEKKMKDGSKEGKEERTERNRKKEGGCSSTRPSRLF